ncbi:hypothetical protein CFOL_v3_11899, partial [Cephalotus follicularis]
MVELYLKEPNWSEDIIIDVELTKKIVSLLNDLGSVIWSVMMTSGSGGGRLEARFWLCKTISGITCVTPSQQRQLFVRLLRSKTRKKRALAAQLLQMVFEKMPRKAGAVLARKSYVLEKFFQGKLRIIQWFSSFAGGGGRGGLEQLKGAKALSQFAFVNRDVCWEELEWKGKHGQSPAMVATKPHYFLDLDVQRTVENFLENVPEFWSSDEFAESLKDGEIFSIDTKFFVDLFVDLMFIDDSRDVWEIIDEFLMEEPFSSLCHHLLIILEECDFCVFLELLHKYIDSRVEPKDFGNSHYWLEILLSEYSDYESIDHVLLLNAVANQGRLLLRLLGDQESQEEQTKVKDIISHICTTSSNASSLTPILKECLKIKTAEAMKLLGLHSWVLLYALSEECQTPASWESLFTINGIKFRKSHVYALLNPDGLSEESEPELDYRATIRRKHRKKDKRRKKRRKFDPDDSYDNKLPDFDAANNRRSTQSNVAGWLLATDGFSASWTSVNLPEHLSKHCLSTWMKWFFSR